MQPTSRRASLRLLFLFLVRAPARLLIVLIRIYQRTIGPLLGPRCRFYPSCSEFWVGALVRYGFWRGILKGLLRLSRCHPFHPGGYDPP